MTDNEDIKRFGEFINDFSEEEYEKYIEGEESTWKNGNVVNPPSDKQRDLAMSVRTPLSEEEQEDIEREQSFTPDSGVREVDTEPVYDNHDLAPSRVNVTIEVPRDNSPIRVLPLREGIRQNITTANLPKEFIVVNPQPSTKPTITRQPNIFKRFISRINIFRRKR